MTVSLNGRSDLVDPAARVIRTAIDTGDGGSEQQRHLFSLLASLVWERPDLDLEALEPISPRDVTELFDDPIAARRLRMMLGIFQYLRKPLTSEQMALIDGFCVALGDDDEALRMARRLLRDELDSAAEHLRAAWAMEREAISDATLRERYDVIDTPIFDPEFAAEMHRLHDLPRGTLGRECFEFYLRYDFDVPGEGVPNPAFWVRHDMSHVLAGFGPALHDELALAAFQIGMADTDGHWMQFVVRIAADEMGLLEPEAFAERGPVMSRPGALEDMLEAFNRGALCSANYSEAPLLEMAHRSVRDVRAEFGVPDPPVPYPPHIDIV